MKLPFSYQFYSTTAKAWEAMQQAILGAKESIYWEVYILVDDAAGARFVDALCLKAEEGLDVKLVADAIGSNSLSTTAEFKLKQSGVKFVWFNRLAPGIYFRDWIRRIWHRSHRKVLIIDEEMAFVGGVNVRQSASEWYDLHVKLTGKIVRQLIYGFAKDYALGGGDRADVKHLLHPRLYGRLNLWRDKIKVLLHSPLHVPRQAPFSRAYHRALRMAKRRFTLVTPYYAPDKEFLRLIAKAMERGVKVDIILPLRPDITVMRYIGQAFYFATLKAGAKIHLLDRMIHAKAASADDNLGLIGSANFTPRGLNVNQEAGVMFTGGQMVNELNHILDEWKKEATMFDDKRQFKAGWWGKMKERWWRWWRGWV